MRRKISGKWRKFNDASPREDEVRSRPGLPPVSRHVNVLFEESLERSSSPQTPERGPESRRDPVEHSSRPQTKFPTSSEPQDGSRIAYPPSSRSPRRGQDPSTSQYQRASSAHSRPPLASTAGPRSQSLLSQGRPAPPLEPGQQQPATLGRQQRTNPSGRQQQQQPTTPARRQQQLSTSQSAAPSRRQTLPHEGTSLNLPRRDPNPSEEFEPVCLSDGHRLQRRLRCGVPGCICEIGCADSTCVRCNKLKGSPRRISVSNAPTPPLASPSVARRDRGEASGSGGQQGEVDQARGTGNQSRDSRAKSCARPDSKQPWR
jgi:hypothetical protein